MPPTLNSKTAVQEAATPKAAHPAPGQPAKATQAVSEQAPAPDIPAAAAAAPELPELPHPAQLSLPMVAMVSHRPLPARLSPVPVAVVVALDQEQAVPAELAAAAQAQVQVQEPRAPPTPAEVVALWAAQHHQAASLLGMVVPASSSSDTRLKDTHETRCDTVDHRPGCRRL